MSQHRLLLQPTDILFFRDGRPMEGSSPGHGAAWPLPHVLDAALHHALRRAEWDGFAPHAHGPKRSGVRLDSASERTFGSLQSAGPFPVDPQGRWHFPRPADAALRRSSATTHRPACVPDGSASSLPEGLLPVVNTRPPSKGTAEPWLSLEAYRAYLGGGGSPAESHYADDATFFAAEHQIGIGMDPETGTQDGERFYSASYLRMREGWRLGMLARCLDQGEVRGAEASHDLIRETFPNSGQATRIVAGGQQRICTVQRETLSPLPLPLGEAVSGNRVRWTLLSPAVWPALEENPDRGVPRHRGGWLPTWVHPETMRVQLKPPVESRRLPREGRRSWRQRVAALPPIGAKLVAALCERSLPVTGWALVDDERDGEDPNRCGGARSTHLAVPAGSVYYFEADSADEAAKLAAALNWHGDTDGAEIRHRRSALFGEKGFGLGVCSGWGYHAPAKPD